jgi:hypothetical protein
MQIAERVLALASNFLLAGTTTFHNVSWMSGRQTTPVPEPLTISLLGIGLVGLIGVTVKQRFKGE